MLTISGFANNNLSDNVQNITEPHESGVNNLIEYNDNIDFLGIVDMSSQSLDNDIIKVTINAKDFTKPVLGIAFYLNFNYQDFSFLKYEPGSFLESGGDPLYLVNENHGKVVFGETLNSDSTFPTGGGIITTMYFQKNKDTAVMQATFSNGVISTLDIVRQDLDPILWKNLQNTIITFTPSSEKLLTQQRDVKIANYSTNKKYKNFIIPPILAVFVLFFIKFIKKTKT